MGGRGSGRRYFDAQPGSKRTNTGNCPVDIRTLHRHGYLASGTYSTWQWWRGRETDKANGASIGCLSLGDHVLFIYQHGRGAAAKPIKQPVYLEWTPCNYGGRRPWWTCPSCSRRVAVVYGAGELFACRHCYNLCYTCQQETPSDRALHQAWKIRERLGQKNGGYLQPVPDKPKWMRWKTYWRLYRECRAHEASWANIIGQFY